MKKYIIPEDFKLSLTDYLLRNRPMIEVEEAVNLLRQLPEYIEDSNNDSSND